MAFIVKAKQKEYSAAPEGLWPAICCDMVDIGEQNTQYGPKHMVKLVWILDPTDSELVDPKNGKPYMASGRYGATLGEKGRLRPMLESWRGKKFSKEELEGFDLESVVGICCQVQIVHNIVKDDVYANVQNVVPFPRGMTKLRVPEEYVRVSEREKRAQFEKNPNGDAEEFRATDEMVPF